MERFSSIYSDLSPMTYSINWPITVRSAVPFRSGNYYGPTPVAPRRRCRKNRRAAADAENLGTARRRRHRRYFTGAPPLQ